MTVGTIPYGREGGMMLAEARNDPSLLVSELDGELVIYDTIRNEAHWLSQTSARIWRRCDGKTSIAELVATLNESTDTTCDEDLVWLGLQDLANAHLLKQPLERRLGERLATRRSVLRRLSVAGSAAVLPLVMSIVAPTPAAAQTCLADGSPCVSSSQCCSGCCNAGSLRCVGAGNCLP